MNTTTDSRIDVRPGTLPAGTLRVASNGNEWLVLADFSVQAASHTCGRRFVAWGYGVTFTDSWLQCWFDASCPAIVRSSPPARKYDHHYDTLAEAHAAFDRMEQEWQHRCPPSGAVNTSPHDTCWKCR